MDTAPDSPETAPLLTVIKALGHTLGQELRRKMVRLLVSLAAIIVILVILVSLTIAGVHRLADALTLACHSWLNDAVLGDLLSGFTLIFIPLGILFIVRSRLLR